MEYGARRVSRSRLQRSGNRSQEGRVLGGKGSTVNSTNNEPLTLKPAFKSDLSI
jgi:hypothetical protein